MVACDHLQSWEAKPRPERDLCPERPQSNWELVHSISCQPILPRGAAPHGSKRRHDRGGRRESSDSGAGVQVDKVKQAGVHVPAIGAR